MNYSKDMQAVERLYGKPLKEVITDLYLELRSMAKVAARLNLTRTGLGGWCRRAEIDTVDLRVAAMRADGLAPAKEPEPAGV